LHDRRTVVLNLPIDVQAAPAVAHSVAPSVVPLRPARAVRADPAAIGELADLIAQASRPVFVAGRGARGAAAELRLLADRCGALLATSAVANGLFHDDPWSLGISGGFASPLTAELIKDADLIVGWGCALNRWTMRQGKLIGADARIAQVDVEQAALGAHRPIDLGVRGDVGLVARDVAAAVPRSPGCRSAELRSRIGREVRWRDVHHDDISTGTRIDPRTLSIGMDDLLPAHRVVSVDSGNFMGYPSAYLSVPDENGFCFTQAFQSIGLGLGTAIGAALAQPDRLPVAALGDGGFLMGVSEVDTAVRLGLPLVILVYNDSAYGAEVHHFTESSADELATVVFPETDLAAIGRGFGADAVTVRTRDDLAEVAEWLSAKQTKPLVIDAKVAVDGGSWWLAEAFGH
jgi:thiamine pyrophosphate-dependent acetolactate synthase large subunit-like protein